MMDHQLTIVLAIVAGIVGFAGYCAAAVFHVWRSRNRDANAAVSPVERYAKRTALVVVAVGLVGLFAVVVQHFFIVREGVLEGENLAAIRARDGFEAVWTTPKKVVRQGEVLMRLHSPEVESEIDVRRLQLDELRADIKILEESPLALDDEVARSLSQVDNEQLHALARLDENKREQARVGRELARTRLDVEDQINGLDVELAQLERQLAQAHCVLKYNQAQLARSDALRKKGAVSISLFEDWRSKTAVAQDEVDKLDARIKRTESQKADLQGNLRSLSAEMKKQSTDFRTQMDLNQKRLERAALNENRLQEQLSVDRQRAAKIRQYEIDQLQIRAKQLESEIQTREESLQVTSPIAGRIVFCEASPRTVEPGKTLLVVAPQDGLTVRVRLPKWQQSSLEDSGEIPLELSDEVDQAGKIADLLVSKTFTATLVDWRELAGDNSHGVAVLRCDPPEEASALLVSGGALPAKLVWRPKLIHNPLFLPACVMFCLGTAVLASVGLFNQRWLVMATAQELEDLPGNDRESEAESLEFVGRRIREMILHNTLHDEVLTRAEAALDEHRTAAARCFASQLDCEHELRPRLIELLRQSDAPVGSRMRDEQRRQHARRLFEIIGQVRPNLILFDNDPAPEVTDFGFQERLYGP